MQYLVNGKIDECNRERMGRCEDSSGADAEKLYICVNGVEGQKEIEIDNEYTGEVESGKKKDAGRHEGRCDGGCTIGVDLHIGMMGYFCIRCGGDNLQSNEF